jgi:hypothetical protein
VHQVIRGREYTAHGPKRVRPGCPVGTRRFWVAIVGGDFSDSHAAETKRSARELANPDRGSAIAWFRVCARDAGEARLIPSRYDR